MVEKTSLHGVSFEIREAIDARPGFPVIARLTGEADAEVGRKVAYVVAGELSDATSTIDNAIRERIDD